MFPSDLKISLTLDKNPKLFWDSLEKSFGRASFFTLLDIEEKVYGAHLIGEKILSIRKKIKEDIKNGGTVNLISPEIMELNCYQYFFFCCCRKIHAQLFGLSKRKEIKLELQEKIKQILPKSKILADERNSLEHGFEYYWRAEDGKKMITRRVHWEIIIIFQRI